MIRRSLIPVPFNNWSVTFQVPKPHLLKPQASRGVYTRHANGTSQELCGKDAGTATCSISLCQIILSSPYDSPGCKEVCWGDCECEKMAHSPSAGLGGWCWAACTRHPPSSHGEWIKAAHDDTSAHAHCSLQHLAMATKVSCVARNVFRRWEERFQRWCLMLPVPFMLPDAEECTDAHPCSL